jgi:RNA polymerase sigma-70 factor (ECF subfamily)
VRQSWWKGSVSDEEFLEEALAHLDMVFNLARRRTSGIQEAEDLVQETYLRALRGWRRARPERTAPWLATICLNVARSHHRRRAARPPEVLDPAPGLETPSPEDTAEQALDTLDRVAVHRALLGLSVEQREAITLMDLCGFTSGQVAEMLGVPRNTVLTRVHRGHKRLVVLLKEITRRDP